MPSVGPDREFQIGAIMANPPGRHVPVLSGSRIFPWLPPHAGSKYVPTGEDSVATWGSTRNNSVKAQ